MTKPAPRMMFVNLPVRNLKQSMAFFTALGFTFNLRFTNEVGACMIVSDSAYVMLLEDPFFQTFTHRKICDTATHTEALLCISCDSREAVKQMVETAVQHGGHHALPSKDHGVMFGWSFYDLDGHHWEPAWMDASMDAECGAEPVCSSS